MGCPRGTWVQPLYGDKRASVVEPRGGIPNTIVGLFVLGVLNNGLDHVNIDSFLKILIRGLILLAALVINVYAQQLRERTAE